ncbi:MAG TPA: M56 family metallopeptidase, partial [Terriglobales bacterium]
MTTTLSQVSQGVFAAGVEAVAKVTIVLLLAWMASTALRRASAALRHLLATIAIFLVLVMPWLIRLGPQWRIPVLPIESAAHGTVGTVTDAAVLDAEPIATPNGAEPLARRKAERQAKQQKQRRTYTDSQEVSLNNPTTTAIAAAPVEPTHSPRTTDWKLWVLLVWVAGVFVLVVRLSSSYLSLRKSISRSERLTDAAWTELALDIERDLRIGRPVRLLKSSEVDVPITAGFLYPRVLLPVEAPEWNLERRRVVLLHEFAHIKRLDALTQLLAQIAVALYWFHPLVWWAACKMQREREHACDDFVLSAGARASDYAGDLLDFGSRTRPQAAYGAALAMARRSQLEGRLLAVLDGTTNRSSVSFGTFAAVALVACAIALPVTALRAIGAQTSNQPTATERNPPKASAPSTTPAKPEAQASAPALPSTVEASPAPAASAAPTMGIASTPQTAEGAPAAVSEAVSQSAPASPGVPSSASTSATARSSNSYSYGYTTGGSEKLQAFECKSDGHSMSDWIQSNNGRRTWKASWSGVGPNGERCNINLYAEGNIVFKTDLSGIQSISPGGFLEISASNGPHFRKVTAKPNGAGNVELSWTVDSQPGELGDQERGWLAAFLLALERQTAFSAETRVPALLQKGGPNAVLDEVNNMTADYARSRYLLLMLEKDKLDNAQLLRTIEFTGKNMGSDYEHARVLLQVAKQYSLDDETSRRAFLNSSNGLKSDYEHARVLLELLKRPRLSTETRNSAIQSANNIHSNFERARVLIAATCDCDNVAPAPLPAVFYEAANGIGSDFEHSRVLLAVIDNKKQQLSPEDAKNILQSAKHIGSDYERWRVLTGFIDRKLLSESLVPMFLDASESIHSDNDHGTVLIAL